MHAPETKRQVLGHVMVCMGCCCGRTEKGKPPVPVDWLKTEWKKRKLLRWVHLTVSGCLGPCDLTNVVAILSPEGQQWLGGIADHHLYEALLAWAEECAAAQRLLPLPTVFDAHRFERYQHPVSEGGAVCQTIACP